VANPNPSPETRFKAGNRANPGGRPKGRSLTEAIRAYAHRTDIAGVEIKGGRTVGEIVVETLYKLALKGDLAAIKLTLDRHDGLVRAGTEQDESTANAIDPEVARRILEAVDPDTLPSDPEPIETTEADGS
jgi:Family of unknown function (DUF5681)